MTEPDDTEQPADWLDAAVTILFIIICALTVLNIVGMAARV